MTKEVITKKEREELIHSLQTLYNIQSIKIYERSLRESLSIEEHDALRKKHEDRFNLIRKTVLDNFTVKED